MAVRFKRTQKRRFHALHNAVDTNTLMISAARVMTKTGGGSKFMVPLIRRVSMRELEAVYCDRTYISRRNVQFIIDIRTYPAVEPKSSLSINSICESWQC
jgi:hypothetical protein